VLSGLVPPTDGRVVFEGRPITGARPERVVKAGIAHVPQGRRLFDTMTVQQNLRLGAYLRHDAEVGKDLDRVVEYFPALRDKLARLAGNLSGGEKQMVAIRLCKIALPQVMLFAELSLIVCNHVVLCVG